MSNSDIQPYSAITRDTLALVRETCKQISESDLAQAEVKQEWGSNLIIILVKK
ncbi:MAG: hypothetical protein LPK02_07495 [Rhodobacterales bacterium]|nr:hypothetical protein [Rhodobacterales bacterium]